MLPNGCWTFPRSPVPILGAHSHMNRILIFLAAFAMAATALAQGPAPGGPQAGQLNSRAVQLAKLKDGAQQYFQGGKYEEAIKRVEEDLGMLNSDEKFRDVERFTYLMVAECYYRLGKEDNFNKAISYWKIF